MWRIRKTWEGPSHPWIKYRIDEERELLKEYGLKNKRELWKAFTIARKIRHHVRYLNARKAAGFNVSKDEEAFMRKLIKYGFIKEGSSLSDVLRITVRDVLDRRLQTIVYKKGLARTIKQARQLIVHGHIMVGENVITSPGYLVKRDEEDKISYCSYSPISNEDHPLRKSIKGISESKPTEEKKE
ncbi:30S ribosomal protein S4 [Nanoarchaeota archaeon NZ13-N]|uniref:Small ribosomal subunit protein uS4 n=1 Tax=Candidatus Nanoclepta minutus TaxID=1940235 RepID=A0A397WPF0_9ARCH|nr:MAG: 30S ribosomal protein S4 [Nanoarchaeota archaeon NZ13-N]RIB35447.1 MAG: 30S ribosomal protein S4 [Candidatus Nanoclepta minutus]